MSKLYVFPLKQHIGAAALPTVRVGDRVLRGQMLAEKPENALGSNIFSSVSGTVSGLFEDAVTVAADENQDEGFLPLTETNPLKLIEQSGLVGLGGAGFPTYAKLSQPFSGDGIVIINAAECEPILSHNIRMIESAPQKLIRGLEIAMEIMHAAKGVIAIKEIHGRAVERLRTMLPGSVSIHLLPDQYPMGEERAIVREVLGVLLPVTSLPLEAGAVILNAETAMRIAEAVDEKKPLIDKDLTIAGKLSGNRNLIQTFHNLPLGMSVRDAFDLAGGLAGEYGELIMGGPFTGKRTHPDAPIIKTTGGLIAAECFIKGPPKIGLLVCACGAQKERMEELAESMGSAVVGVEYCKQAAEVKNARKCENPGKCPGQVQKVMELKKRGAQALLISNCTDCSNTVMSCAPKLGLPVYHCTDGSLRAVNHKLIRKIHKT